MKIKVLTLFKEMYEGFLSTSIIHRAIENDVVDIEVLDIREYALDKFKHVDDKPFGGGAGMVLKCQPVLDCLNANRNENSHVILTSPRGKQFTQEKAHALSKLDEIIILCGHYEGMDERINNYVDEEISIGDYVLTGGELPSMVMIDAIVRLLDGAINEASREDESYEQGLLEYPQYTQPANYEGMIVPQILVSGNHAKIKEWRMLKSLLLTKEKRPDLYESHVFSEEELKILKKYEEDPSYLEYLERGEFK